MMGENRCQKNYQDPDYEDISSPKKNVLSEDEKAKKVYNIINKEFSAEIERKEKEIDFIDQRLLLAKKNLHKLRYAIVNNYYNSKQFQLTEEDVRKEVVSQKDPIARAKVHTLLRDEQKRIHPALKKILGPKSDVELDSLFKIRSSRKRSKPSTSGNLTIPFDGSVETLRSQIKSEIKTEGDDDHESTEFPIVKIPRYVEPKDMEKNVLKINTSIRNKQKEKFRIIIGNTSKYTPPHSEMDRSTHRWLLYIRGPRDSPEVSHFIESVTVKLDNSYAPHNVITLNSPPFHLSRRGWGEFDVSLRIHFKNQSLNKPVNLIHNLKLDRNYTGLQTLGGETVVDVWLYSDESMLANLKTNKSANDASTNPKLILGEPNVMNIKQETLEDDQNNVESIDNALKSSHNTSSPSQVVTFIKSEPLNYEESGNISESHLFHNIKEENGVLDVRVNDSRSKMNSKPNMLRDRETTQGLKSKSLVKTHPNSLLKISEFSSESSQDSLDHLNLDPNIRVILEDHCYLKTSFILHHLLGGDHCVDKKREISIDTLVPINSTEAVGSYNGYKHIENKTMDHITSTMNFFKMNIDKMDSIRSIVSLLLKRMPLIHKLADDEHFQKIFPFSVKNKQDFFKLHYIKRRNLEWTRAKIIKNYLRSHWTSTSQNVDSRIWSVKQIILFSHCHGFFPVKNEEIERMDDNDGNIFLSNDKILNVNEINSYTNIKDFNTNNITRTKEHKDDTDSITDNASKGCLLDNMKSEYSGYKSEDSDNEVDILYVQEENMKDKHKTYTSSNRKVDSTQTVIPFIDRDEELMCSFIEKVCAKQGIELRNEDVGNSYSDCLVHKTILCALKCLIEDILRRSLALKMARLWGNQTSEDKNDCKSKNIHQLFWERIESGLPISVGLREIYKAINTRPELDLLTNSGLGTFEMDYSEAL